MASERNQEIIQRLKSGESLQSVADSIRVSRERIRQIGSAAGISGYNRRQLRKLPDEWKPKPDSTYRRMALIELGLFLCTGCKGYFRRNEGSWRSTANGRCRKCGAADAAKNSPKGIQGRCKCNMPPLPESEIYQRIKEGQKKAATAREYGISIACLTRILRDGARQEEEDGE